MKTQRKFSILSILLLMSVTMLFASPAYANTSIHYSFDTENNWTWYGM
jgi:hypothetical protein